MSRCGQEPENKATATLGQDAAQAMIYLVDCVLAESSPSLPIIKGSETYVEDGQTLIQEKKLRC
jgi:hypothetical protein